MKNTQKKMYLLQYIKDKKRFMIKNNYLFYKKNSDKYSLRQGTTSIENTI